MKQNEDRELRGNIVMQSWGVDLMDYIIDPVIDRTTGIVTHHLMHCYLSLDGFYTKAHLEQIMERLNAYDYTIQVTSASLLVTYYEKIEQYINEEVKDE